MERHIKAEKLRSCLRYHKGVQMQRRAMKQGWEHDTGRITHDDISRLILDGVNAGILVGVYHHAMEVYCE